MVDKDDDTKSAQRRGGQGQFRLGRHGYTEGGRDKSRFWKAEGANLSIHHHRCMGHALGAAMRQQPPLDQQPPPEQSSQ